MDQNNLIKKHAFSKNEINLVDSFLLNKLGEGHGESTLYLGGKKKHEQIYELFGNSASAKIKLFFSKENFISILNFYQPYFKKPHGFYLNNGKLITFKDGLYDIFKTEMEIIKLNDESFYEYVDLLKPDSQGRIYLRFDNGSILRRVFLPHSVNCVLFSYKNKSEAIFCEIKPVLKPVKKKIKINQEMILVDIDYFKSYN